METYGTIYVLMRVDRVFFLRILNYIKNIDEAENTSSVINTGAEEDRMRDAVCVWALWRLSGCPQ